MVVSIGLLIGVHTNDDDAFMWAMSDCLKHFVAIGVNATGWHSFMHVTTELLGTGMMVNVLRFFGTTGWESKVQFDSILFM